MLGEIVEEIVKEKSTFERVSCIIDVAERNFLCFSSRSLVFSQLLFHHLTPFFIIATITAACATAPENSEELGGIAISEKSILPKVSLSSLY